MTWSPPGHPQLRARLARNVAYLRVDTRLLALDGALVIVAYLTATAFDGRMSWIGWQFWAYTAGAVVVFLAGNAAFGMYGRVWAQASTSEASGLLLAVGVSSALLLGMLLLLDDTGREKLPVALPLNGGALAVLLLGGVRFLPRLGEARHPGSAPDATRVVIAGSTEIARSVINQAQADQTSGLLPVAVVSDEPRTALRSLSGVPVAGSVADLPGVIQRFRAEQLLLVFRGDEGQQLRRAADLGQESGIQTRILPTLQETMGRSPTVRDIRDLQIEDLLGRNQVDIDTVAVRQIVTGRRVLVTGAGGSVGSEISIQLAMLDPALLVLLDHDETHLHDLAARLPSSVVSFLGDIRDEALMDKLLGELRPDIVFHAAAHKHVPVLERFPSEAAHTNVIGTDILVRAARRHGITRFVGISTDKAVNPSSVMGASKRLAEQAVVHRAAPGFRYCAVRFGNVLGSRGSVLPTFMQQLRQGGPLTVTHPQVTRFFMTTREAARLVLQAAALAHGGEVFMLDMGEPVRILDLADRLISLSGARPAKDVRIEFIGLRPGEKLHEELLGAGEVLAATAHPKIKVVTRGEPPSERLFSELGRLRRLAAAHSEKQVSDLLFDLAASPALPGGSPRAVPPPRPRPVGVP